MTAQQRSRFREIHEMIRAMEERMDRRFDWQAEEIARLKLQIARMQARMMPPEAWRDFDEDTERKESA